MLVDQHLAVELSKACAKRPASRSFPTRVVTDHFDQSDLAEVRGDVLTAEHAFLPTSRHLTGTINCYPRRPNWVTHPYPVVAAT